MSQRLAERASEWIGTRTSRRGFLVRTAVGGAALSTSPLDFTLRPISAYAAACQCRNQPCSCGTACCDGYTEFCCTLNGSNTCPPGTIAGGWWKADGSGFCGDLPRYYIDCNVAPGQNPCSCQCALGDCNHRVTCCTQFRYGQCHQEVPIVGAIMCRVVSCSPPWELDSTCTTVVATDDLTASHDAPCLHHYLPAPAPIAVDADWVEFGLFRLYLGILGRYPDQRGFEFYSAQLGSRTLGQLGDTFVASSEFPNASLTDSQFVDLIYQRALGRSADAAGKQYMLGLLKDHTRGEVGNFIAQSQESQTRFAVTIADHLVRRTYLAALLRPGDAGGLYYWTKRAWTVSYDSVAMAFCDTPEFTQRYAAMDDPAFVDALYENTLGRPGDPAGRAYWIDQLQNGRPRWSVVLLFADTPEFKQRTGIS